jgi:DNA processing protein
VKGDDELRVVLAGASSGVDPGRLARRHGCGALLRASPGMLERMGALPALIDALRIARGADPDAYRATLGERGIACLTRSDTGFPDRLRQLHDPPLAVFAAGPRIDALAWPQPVASVVGSRRATESGLVLARRLAAGVAESGGLVVSGLALGVDAAAHDGALSAGGVTVAVLGCGVDVAYPRTNRRLHARIRDTGLLLSEYPPGTPPAPWRFPARNRLIAALADAIVVVEARAGSGALITADHALDLGRDVLAVPGTAGLASTAGANGLLKAGAGLIETADDLCGWLGLPPPPSAQEPPSGDEHGVLSALGDRPATADDLSAGLGLAAARVATALVRLELTGRAARGADGLWRAG